MKKYVCVCVCVCEREREGSVFGILSLVVRVVCTRVRVCVCVCVLYVFCLCLCLLVYPTVRRSPRVGKYRPSQETPIDNFCPKKMTIFFDKFCLPNNSTPQHPGGTSTGRARRPPLTISSWPGTLRAKSTSVAWRVRY